MRHVGLLIARVIFGGYLAVHGVQKLLGAFRGDGPEGTAEFFAQLGLRPSKLMAYLAGASELAGGVLTATGVADPVGPVIIAGTMVVASTTHREQGALAQSGGFELPLTNLALAIALMSSGTGALRLGPRAPRTFTAQVVFTGAVFAGVAVRQVLSPQRPKTSET